MHPKVSELVSKINRLANHSSFPQVSKVEFDLLMQQVRDLYDELDSLRNSKNEEKIVPEPIEPVKEDISFPDEVKPSDENIVLNAVPVKKREVPVKEEVVASKAEVIIKGTRKSSINEIVQSSESLNSKLKHTSKEVHHKLSTKPLKELIDLNKRFILINELFGGSAEVFVQAIHKIDSSDDFNSAESFIQSEFIINYHWNESSETVKLFWVLVKQRFGVEQR